MNGIDFVSVTAVVLLVALAVAAGMQIAQDRAVSNLSAVSKEVRQPQVLQYRTAPRYCSTCGQELHPPI